MEPGKLTRGERLTIARLRDGLSQAEAAAMHRTTRHVYQEWERDKLEGAPLAAIGPLAPHEQCLILRRRAGMTQEEVANALGVSRPWLVEMERGRVSTQRLHTYWATRRESRRQRRT